MAGIVLQRRFARQPQQAVRIDWSNPITRGLTLAWSAAHGDVDLVTGIPGTAAGTPLVRSIGKDGKRAAGTASDNEISWPARADLKFDTAPGQTLFTIVTYDPTIVEGNLMGRVQTDYDYEMRISAASQQFNFVSAHGGVTVAVPNGSFGGGLNPWGNRPVAAACTNDLTTLRAYLDGIEQNSASSAGQTFSSANDRFAIFARGGGGGAGSRFGTAQSLVLVFRRALSAAEIKSLSANPWQVLKAPPLRLRIPSAGGGSSYTMPAAAGSFLLSGSPTGLQASRKLPVTSGAFALVGNPAALRQGHVAPAAAGSFALTGSPAVLRYGRTPVALPGGAFALAGNAATLRQGHRATAAAGSFVLSGSATRLAQGHLLGAAPGAFALTGSTVALRASRILGASAGAFSLTGYPIAGGNLRILSVSSGSFSLAGSATRLARGTMLGAAPGAFTLAGSAAALRASRRLVAFPGAFSLAAGPAFLVASRRLAASPGAFLVVGPPTTLRAARRAQVTSGGFSLTGYAVGNGIPPTSFRATVLVNGVMRPATQAEVGIGRAPVVLVSGRLRQRVAGEGTPVVAATLGGSTRYRLLRATEALEI